MRCSQNRDSSRINFCSTYNKPWAPSLICFHTILISNLFPYFYLAYFFTFDPYSPFKFFLLSSSLFSFLWLHSGQHVCVVMLLKPSNMVSVHCLLKWSNMSLKDLEWLSNFVRRLLTPQTIFVGNISALRLIVLCAWKQLFMMCHNVNSTTPI